MRRTGVVLFFLLLAATAPDRAYDLLGTWSCETQQGSIGTHFYTRNADGSIALHNDFRTTSGRHIIVDETFRYEAASGRWTVTTAPDSCVRRGERRSGQPWSGRVGARRNGKHGTGGVSAGLARNVTHPHRVHVSATRKDGTRLSTTRPRRGPVGDVLGRNLREGADALNEGVGWARAFEIIGEPPKLRAAPSESHQRLLERIDSI